jgi:hypothetical protein
MTTKHTNFVCGKVQTFVLMLHQVVFRLATALNCRGQLLLRFGPVPFVSAIKNGHLVYLGEINLIQN